MNLNEFLINRGRGKGRKSARNKNYIVTDMGPPLKPAPKRKDYTPSSDLIWGKSHISVPNTSSTHKSASSSKISSEEESRVIVALTEGRGEARCEVGIAAIDVSKPHLVLCQISDTQSYVNTLTKINIFNPQEILVPLTFVETFSGNRLIEKVKERFPRIRYTGRARSTFNKTNGMDVLSKLCIPSLNAILLILEPRYYALAAASALITYVQDSLFVYYATGSIKIDYQESEGYAIIDVATADRLELVCSAKPAQGNKYSSLFGVLNHCLTKIGSRTLRSLILQPPCRVEYIEERLEAVVELIRHPEMLLSIQALLQKISNIDLLLGIATLIPDDPQRCSNRQLNYILLLNALVDLVTPLRDVLARSQLAPFVRLAATLSGADFGAIKDLVRQTVQENAHPAKGQVAIMQRCFAIKAGINGLLDLVRKTYSERLEDMREYVKSLAAKYDLALTLSNNQTKGYHIVLTLNQNQKRHMKKSDLPEEFIEVYRLAGSFTMKTPELVNLTTRLDDIMADILKISNVMVHAILVKIKKYVPLFYKLCEGIAYLDVLQSLAECSVGNGYVRPSFGDFTEVSFSHHPLLDFLLTTKPIPNPISCSTDFNVHIITGPNGSGKSIFIRQVMLLQIMAQLGCFVPAQSAIFRPADRMYARIYLGDNMEHGASSFILEMKEIKYIMTTMTKNSLIIIDELCRSTSLEEGTALAIATVEKLAQSSAFIYITTHFTLLTKLYDMYLNVKVWQLETIPSGDDPKTFKLDFRHALKPGLTSVRRYGVYIVRNIWPDFILKYVDDLLECISKKPKDAMIVPNLDARIRLKYELESQFRKLKSQRKLTRSAINKLLNQYQNEMENIGHQTNIGFSPICEGEEIQELPQIHHSIFGDLPHESYSETEDARIKQNFTPETFVSSQLSFNLDMRREESMMRQVFTPEASQLSLNHSCPNLSFYGRSQQLECFPEGYPHDANKSYEKMSLFLAENSENFQKLVPQVNISYEEMYDAHQNTSIVRRTPENFEKVKGSSESSSLNEFRFSLPLETNAAKTSTPIIQRPSLPRSASPVVHVYSGRHFSTTSNSQDQTKYSEIISQQAQEKNIDLQSIQEDLEVCSMIFSEAEDEFDEASFNTTYKSLPEAETNQRSRHEHVMAVVTVIEGPNDPSSDEDNYQDIPEDDCERAETVPKKINIISDIVIAPGREERVNEDVSEEKESDQFKLQTVAMDQSQVDVVDDHLEENYASFMDVNSVDDNECYKGGMKSYKNFDSTYEATRTDGEEEPPTHLNDSFRSVAKEDTFQSCQNGDQDNTPNQEASKYISSEYDISVIEDPKKFLTPEEDKTNKEEKSESSGNGEKSRSPHTADKTEVTGISYASRVRNLDHGSTESTSQEDSDEKKTITSISSASRKRNLDQAISDSTSPTEKFDEKTKDTDKSETSSSMKESDENKSDSKTVPKRKFSVPRTKDTQNEVNKVKKGAFKKKFVPPRRLSVREIKEEFKEQDRKILESTLNSSDLSKYLEQLINRPTAKQIQNTTHLATVRKTEHGVEVIPGKPAKKKTRTSWTNHSSKENFDVTIFSDKNALSFGNYLNSNEKDYKTFSFNFNRNQEGDQKLEFAPTGLSFGEYTSNSVTARLVRTASEMAMDCDGGNKGESRVGTETNELAMVGGSQLSVTTMTPDGFYKQNKDDIARIMGKYLQSDGRGAFGSIFESGEIDTSNLNL